MEKQDFISLLEELRENLHLMEKETTWKENNFLESFYYDTKEI